MAEEWMLKGLFAVSSHVTFSAKAGLLRAAACPPLLCAAEKSVGL